MMEKPGCIKEKRDAGYRKSLLQIHIAVFFLGLSALAGKWSSQNALVLTFARVWISSPALLLYLLLRRFPLRLHCRRDYGVMALLGALWAAHWVTFLHSAQGGYGGHCHHYLFHLSGVRYLL